MNCRHTIVAALLWALAPTSEAALRFGMPQDFPDLDLTLPLPAEATPDPVELPRAASFFVTEKGASYLEDRFDALELWRDGAIRGRWRDEDGNRLTLARLRWKVPEDLISTALTRKGWRAARRALDPKNTAARDAAVREIAPKEIERIVKPRRAIRRNFETILDAPTADDRVLVTLFKPRATERGVKTDWYAAILEVAAQEPLNSATATFNADFLDRVAFLPPDRNQESEAAAEEEPTEAALQAEDYALSVVNYANWHATTADDVTVVDDLDEMSRTTFVTALTNELPRLRKAYAQSAPSPLAGDPHPASVRVFATREEYLAYVSVDRAWTAAIWDPTHRELVLYLPQGGTEELIRTVRHEAFHQYLAYAAALQSASPWFNEGHAELFARAVGKKKGWRKPEETVFEFDAEDRLYIRTQADRLVEILPEFLQMDYEEFYGGTAEEVRARYRVAWSIAWFLEKGAPLVRFRPFETLRADYLAELVETRDAHEATRRVFTKDKLEAFAKEWRAYWKK